MSKSSFESGESRKRTLTDDHSDSPMKRANSPRSPTQMNVDTDNMHFKILVPSGAAGAIIGKGGETIAHLQQESGARIRMSKANDCYPGTNERVCLILGNIEAIEYVHDFITEKIAEKPDSHPQHQMHPQDDDMTGSNRIHAEREKQVKILVPNCTAGMIIGKGGAYIKQIQEESGAYLQLSQKAKDQRLPERCVTVVGDTAQRKKATRMILGKISEDPNSGSCPDVSYAALQRPVANFNPTGSPFAGGPGGQMSSPQASSNQAMGGGSNQLAQATAMLQLFSSVQIAPQQFLDNMQIMLKNTGYPDASVVEIMGAMQTLLKYGLLGIALGLPNLGTATNTSTTSSNMYGNTQQQSFNYNNGTSSFSYSGDQQQQQGFGGSGGGMNDSASQLIATMANIGGMGSNQGGGASGGGKAHSLEMEIPESLVGVIIGPQGKSIVDLQSSSGTNIQISKKGVYAPGTTNRVVTITGPQSNVMNAQIMIQQVISSEELRRSQENSR